MGLISMGIDIGGTFTDVVMFDHGSAKQFSTKELTTHSDPAQGAINGVRILVKRYSIDPGKIGRVVHATTLFTNALLERRGAATGLLTTNGFRDTLEIGRERKYDLYDIGITNPPPLVPRALRREVGERMLADGTVLTPLNLADVTRETDVLIKAGVESVAIAFLHSYANPRHELEAAEFVRRRAPHLFVSLSHEVASEIREYERVSTVVANAYVQPLAGRYIDNIVKQLGELGISAPLQLMLSNGGLTTVDEAKRVPIEMLESGPAAGALAAAHFGMRDGERKLLAFDMGGTTAKLCVVEEGEPMTAYSFETARQQRFMEGSGLPIRISTVELIEIGAGGGSIARKNEMGLLKVGPESAGSEPGPASYQRGGTEPTVTDCNFDLGLIHPATFAGGKVPIDVAFARTALDRLARDLKLERGQVSAGILNVVNENMTAAARVHIAERGRDPSTYAILCTGGGGPVHGYQVARKLGIKRLICPPEAGVASALGLIVAPVRADRVKTIGFYLDNDELGRLERAFCELEGNASALIVQSGVIAEEIFMRRLADGRFVGQGFDLVVPLPPGPFSGDEKTWRAKLRSAFEDVYRQKFGRTPPSLPIEFINIRVSAQAPVIGATSVSESSPLVKGTGQTRKVFFPESDAFLDTGVFNRRDLRPGDSYLGPAVIEEDGSTLVVGPDARFDVSPSRNIVVTLP